jgi:hypothetical protein
MKLMKPQDSTTSRGVTTAAGRAPDRRVDEVDPSQYILDSTRPRAAAGFHILFWRPEVQAKGDTKHQCLDPVFPRIWGTRFATDLVLAGSKLPPRQPYSPKDGAG